MPDYRAFHGESVFFFVFARLRNHFGYGFVRDFGIVGGGGVFLRRVRANVFLVGQVDIHKSAEFVYRFGFFVPRTVIHYGDMQFGLCDTQKFFYSGKIVTRGY